MRYLVAFVFFVLAVGTLRVVGCGEPTGPGGSGGNGGSAGAGGGGVGGDGGTGGDGGVGGDPLPDLVDQILTHVDPPFVYPYAHAQFVPPAG